MPSGAVPAITPAAAYSGRRQAAALAHLQQLGEHRERGDQPDDDAVGVRVGVEHEQRGRGRPEARLVGVERAHEAPQRERAEGQEERVHAREVAVVERDGRERDDPRRRGADRRPAERAARAGRRRRSRAAGPSAEIARVATSPPPNSATSFASRKCSGAPPRTSCTVSSSSPSGRRATMTASASSRCMTRSPRIREEAGGRHAQAAAMLARIGQRRGRLHPARVGCAGAPRRRVAPRRPRSAGALAARRALRRGRAAGRGGCARRCRSTPRGTSRPPPRCSRARRSWTRPVDEHGRFRASASALAPGAAPLDDLVRALREAAGAAPPRSTPAARASPSR